MAEGDSILRVARRMDAALAGSRVSVRTPGRRRPDGLPPTSIDGLVLERVESRGKHLLLHFEESLVLHSHLGMRGGWHLYRTGERWRRPAHDAWIALAGNESEAVNFGGSKMRIVAEGQLDRDPRLARLGPDILAEAFEPTAAIARMRGTNPQIELGEALLGQRLVAGIGNIFKSEGCFEAGSRSDRPPRIARRRAARRRPRGDPAPDARGGRIRAPAEAGLPASGRTVSALWCDHPSSGAGRRRADDLLVPGLPDGLNPR